MVLQELQELQEQPRSVKLEQLKIISSMMGDHRAECQIAIKEEHEDFTGLMASDAAAKELLKFAENRLNKFYNPSLSERGIFI